LIIDSYRSAYDELCIAQLFSGFVVFFVRNKQDVRPDLFLY
jgi:hypothetical protein